MSAAEDFNVYRMEMSEKILASDNLMMRKILVSPNLRRVFKYWEEFQNV